ncbi:MAG TPA: DNA alkylation repair protein [Thermoanaerobaculia bacterium]
MTARRKRKTQTARAASRRLRALADPKRSESSAWFFRTGPGEYGEGDRFLGIPVPTLRRQAGDLDHLPLPEIRKLLASPWHEERLLALLVLVRRYQRGEETQREQVFRFYMAQSRRVDNWDLVDVSAPSIVGAHLSKTGGSVLRRLARSRNLWDRRIAIVSTLGFIRRGDLGPTFDLARLLLDDSHDLIHKAAGWILREAGRRDPRSLRDFLARHASRMPRTMLRYAIERFPDLERREWLARGAR